MNKSVALIAKQCPLALSDVKDSMARLGFSVDDVSLADVDGRLTRTDNVAVIMIEASMSGVEQVHHIRRRNASVAIVMCESDHAQKVPVEAFRAGVDDYLRYPVCFEELEARLLILSKRKGGKVAPGALAPDRAAKSLIGASPSLRKITSYIDRVAVTDTTVLITGETGTGKELVAEMICRYSRRADKPFISVNCAAIPETLLESELFGHEKGAFTGATMLQRGKFELAEGGTLFLDEIGDLGQSAQAKILRVLENKHVQRIGGKGVLSLDVRIISATNQGLDHLIAQDRFRKDLYYRLNVARIHIPPLRERREDIPFLLAHFIDEYNRRFGYQVQGVTEAVLECLLRYDWPGNVRELRNVVESIFVDLSSAIITIAALPDHLRSGALTPQDTERDKVLLALLVTKWNKTKAAQRLNWSRMTLYRKLAKYHLAGPDPTLSPAADTMVMAGIRPSTRKDIPVTPAVSCDGG
jgi:DNA-binding NtrC family response regulator